MLLTLALISFDRSFGMQRQVVTKKKRPPRPHRHLRWKKSLLEETYKPEPDVNVISTLLSKGVKANGANTFSGTLETIGISPICNTAWTGHLEATKLLLENGVNPGKIVRVRRTFKTTALHEAVKTRLDGGQYKEVVKALLDRNAPINAGGTIHMHLTPLMLLVSQKSPSMDILDLLLQSDKLKLNKCNYTGKTVLHIAAIRGHKCIVRRLIDEKAEVNTVDVKGFTPLLGAINAGSLDCALYLCGAGAKPNLGEHDSLCVALKCLNVALNRFLTKNKKNRYAQLMTWLILQGANCGNVANKGSAMACAKNLKLSSVLQDALENANAFEKNIKALDDESKAIKNANNLKKNESQ